MTWTRLSDNFYDNDDINELSHEAFRLHVYALVWCNKQLTDGLISHARCRRLLPDIDTAAAIVELIAHSLWTDVGKGEYQVDWTDQERAEAVKRRQQRNAEDQARYRERQERHLAGDHSICTKNCPQRSTQSMSKALTEDVSEDAPSRPVPSQGKGQGRGRAGRPKAASADRSHNVSTLRVTGICGHPMIDDRYCEVGCLPHEGAAS